VAEPSTTTGVAVASTVDVPAPAIPIVKPAANSSAMDAVIVSVPVGVVESRSRVASVAAT